MDPACHGIAPVPQHLPGQPARQEISGSDTIRYRRQPSMSNAPSAKHHHQKSIGGSTGVHPNLSRQQSAAIISDRRHVRSIASAHVPGVPGSASTVNPTPVSLPAMMRRMRH